MKKLCLSLLSVLFWGTGSAQTADLDFRDGFLIFKTLVGSELSLPEYPSGSPYPYMDSLIAKQGVTQISKSFPETTNPHHAGLYEVYFDSIERMDAFIADLYQYTFTEFACGEPIRKPLAEPDDPKYAFQWAYKRIMADSIWQLLPGTGREIKIGVIDDAFLLTHEDFSGVIYTNPGELGGDEDGNGFPGDFRGWDFGEGDNDVSPPSIVNSKEYSHGTHVAGIAGAKTDNDTGIAST